jgi:hypothetical protein
MFAASLLSIACANRVAVNPLPTPPAPNWGNPTKSSGCQANAALQHVACTPGDIIAADTKAVICDPAFRTSTIRDSVTTPEQKAMVYGMYNIPHPPTNTGSIAADWFKFWVAAGKPSK